MSNGRALRSRVDVNSPAFKANYQANAERLEMLDEALKTARAGGGDKYVQRHLSRGKLLPRHRIELLIDRDTHFLELCPLAGYKAAPGIKPGASIVGGIGVVSMLSV